MLPLQIVHNFLEMRSSLNCGGAAVYTSYNANHPPPHPGPDWTRFVCISDTHSRIFPVPPGDVLLHAGDLSSRGTLPQLDVTLNWLKKLPHPIKIIIAGNHDLCLDDNWREGGEWHLSGVPAIRSQDVTAAQALVRSKALVQAGIHYLEHESIDIVSKNGRHWKIYGSPAARRYAVGAFQYLEGEGDAIYSRIPSSTQILLTHTPPYATCDRTRHGKNAGCAELSTRLESGALQQCRLHVFGHIHEAHGAMIGGETEKNPRRVSVNAALPHGGQAVIVDLEN
ncbi:Metallo-dependent phosphatase [Amylocystis lapponica]|nr:Metallo-dependent phosphatase [Amylocystis lapponica]